MKLQSKRVAKRRVAPRPIASRHALRTRAMMHLTSAISYVSLIPPRVTFYLSFLLLFQDDRLSSDVSKALSTQSLTAVRTLIMLPWDQRPSIRGTSQPNSRPLNDQIRPSLSVDTSVTRHHGHTPRQVFPSKLKTQELSFISFADIKALKKGGLGGLKQQLEAKLPTRLGAQRSTSDSRMDPQTWGKDKVRPSPARSQTASFISGSANSESRQVLSRPQALPQRIKGLRPSPLDLTHEISPSDRAITIGLALPSDGKAQCHSRMKRDEHPLRRVEDAQTPTIVITPAKQDFEIATSPEDLQSGRGFRPTSSVYSHYTSYAPGRTHNGITPPVPPLPLFANRKTGRDSAATLFEEDTATQLQTQPSRNLSRQSHLPTPRRSRGWWNLITSPFSAKSNGTFIRSSPPPDEEDRKGILEDASDMPTADTMATHEGVIFLNRAPEDDELRTALPPDTGADRPSVLKRSDTAPAVLDTDVAQINIYNVPRNGLAAAYYRESKQLPSPSVTSGDASHLAKDLVGWSPSQSVADPEQDASSAFSQDRRSATGDERVLVKSNMRTSETPVNKSISLGNTKGASIDPQAPQSQDKSSENIFSTPSEAELQDDTPVNTRPPLQERSETQATQATLTSAFSPLTETPILEEAHSARLASAEPREIRLTPYSSATQLPRQRTLPPGLAQSTMASRGVNDSDAGYAAEKGALRPQIHRRNESSSSIGLGISDVECEKEPFPRVTRGLGTDRFGQLTIRDIDSDSPVRPWYKRFFWSLAFAVTLLLLLLLVLLVAFVPPERHDKNAVQAEWLNLTGFPALPRGVSTVMQPRISREESHCVSPEKLWSCDVPAGSESASSIPNFRFEIVFRNGTVSGNETQMISVLLSMATRRRFTSRLSIRSRSSRRRSSAKGAAVLTPILQLRKATPPLTIPRRLPITEFQSLCCRQMGNQPKLCCIRLLKRSRYVCTIEERRMSTTVSIRTSNGQCMRPTSAELLKPSSRSPRRSKTLRLCVLGARRDSMSSCGHGKVQWQSSTT
ncbi:hypothetical protein KC352_g31 [Hortaea werneckii]|nr:hypothetical protein KC352_g31 [Hortaea werneckii]